MCTDRSSVFDRVCRQAVREGIERERVGNGHLGIGESSEPPTLVF